jgi:AraC-like DNA-binding protein
MANPLAEVLLRYSEHQTGDSPFMTAIPGLAVMRSDRPKPPSHILSGPVVCLVAQGAKWGNFGGQQLEYRAGQALIVGVETPSVGRVFEARPDAPCLVLMFELDLSILRDVAETIETPPSGPPRRGVFVIDFDGPLADCALRLARLLETPQAIQALHPGIMREICYWLLAGPQGGDIARLALKTGPSRHITDALRTLRERFSEAVRVEDLAEVAHMSASAFHRQFKALTSYTPLQYQKHLRLLEARRLMVTHGLNVESAAFEVGYESPSQFSREYARLFGAPPKRDVLRLQLAPAIERDAA